MLKCNKADKEHVKTCSKCLSYHMNLNSTSILPLSFKISRKIHRNLYIITGLEIISMMKLLKIYILQDNRSLPNNQAAFLSELQYLYLNISTKSQESIDLDKFLNFLENEYMNVVIEDIFDALSVIFHYIHSTPGECMPVCSIHKALDSSIFEELTCDCGFTKEISWGKSINYHVALVKTSSESFLKQFTRESSTGECIVCKNPLRRQIKVNKCPDYLIFKLIDYRSSEKYNYREIVIFDFSINQVFATNFSQVFELSIILLKSGNIYRYFIIQKEKAYLDTGEFFNYTQMFTKICTENMAVVGLIYTQFTENDFSGMGTNGLNAPSNFVANSSIRPKQTSGVYCKCGNRCTVGESLCRACVANLRTPTKPKETQIRTSEKVSKKNKLCTCIPTKNEKCIFCSSEEKKSQSRSPVKDLSPFSLINSPQKKVKSEVHSHEIVFKSIVKKCAHCGKEINGICRDCNTSTWCRVCNRTMTNGSCANCRIQDLHCFYCENIIVDGFMCSYCGGNVSETGKCSKCGPGNTKIICQSCNSERCKTCKKSKKLCTCKVSGSVRVNICSTCSGQIGIGQPYYCMTCKTGIIKDNKCTKCKILLGPDKCICYNCRRKEIGQSS